MPFNDLADRGVLSTEYSTKIAFDLAATNYETDEQFPLGDGSFWLEMTFTEDTWVGFKYDNPGVGQQLWIIPYTDAASTPSHTTMVWTGTYAANVGTLLLSANTRYLFQVQNAGVGLGGTGPFSGVLEVLPLTKWSDWIVPDPVQASIFDFYHSVGFISTSIKTPIPVVSGSDDYASAIATATTQAKAGRGYMGAAVAPYDFVVQYGSQMVSKPIGESSTGVDPFYDWEASVYELHWQLDKHYPLDPARWPKQPQEVADRIAAGEPMAPVTGLPTDFDAVWVQWQAGAATIVAGNGILDLASSTNPSPVTIVAPQEQGHGLGSTVTVPYRVNSYFGVPQWVPPVSSSSIVDYFAVDQYPGDQQLVTGGRLGAYDVASLLDPTTGKGVLWVAPSDPPDGRCKIEFFGFPGRVTLPVQYPSFRYRIAATLSPTIQDGTGTYSVVYY